MTFNSNDNMYPGPSSDAGNKTKLNQLDAKVNALQQTVTTIADGLASLGTSVNTNSVTAVVGEIGTVTSDTINADVIESEEATFGTVSSASTESDNVNAETVNAGTLNAETIDAGSASVDSLNVADNLGVVHSVTAESVTAENAEITDTLTANEVDSSSVVTEALEVTGTSTIRGDVTFPEDGDEITGEDLVIHNKSSYVKDLITEEPSDTNNLVGYDLNGKLIPVDGSLDPSNLWRKVDEETIETKEERIISVPGVVAENLTTDEPVKSLKHLTYDEDGKIIPSEIKLSSQPNNAIVENNDGLYAPQLLISEEEGQAIESKADGIFVQKHTAGENVEISDDGVISATDTTYTAGNNITISDDNEISCDISTMNFRGSVQTVADLPSTGNVIGDVWNVVAIATNYCWDGSQFIAIGSSVDVSGLLEKPATAGDVLTYNATSETTVGKELCDLIQEQSSKTVPGLPENSEIPVAVWEESTPDNLPVRSNGKFTLASLWAWIKTKIENIRFNKIASSKIYTIEIAGGEEAEGDEDFRCSSIGLRTTSSGNICDLYLKSDNGEAYFQQGTGTPYKIINESDIADSVTSGNMNPVTSNAVATTLSTDFPANKTILQWAKTAQAGTSAMITQSAIPTDAPTQAEYSLIIMGNGKRKTIVAHSYFNNSFYYRDLFADDTQWRDNWKILNPITGRYNFGKIAGNNGGEVEINLPYTLSGDYIVMTSKLFGGAQWASVATGGWRINESKFLLEAWNTAGTATQNDVIVAYSIIQ